MTFLSAEALTSPPSSLHPSLTTCWISVPISYAPIFPGYTSQSQDSTGNQRLLFFQALLTQIRPLLLRTSRCRRGTTGRSRQHSEWALVITGCSGNTEDRAFAYTWWSGKVSQGRVIWPADLPWRTPEAAKESCVNIFSKIFTSQKMQVQKLQMNHSMSLLFPFVIHKALSMWLNPLGSTGSFSRARAMPWFSSFPWGLRLLKGWLGRRMDEFMDEWMDGWVH